MLTSRLPWQTITRHIPEHTAEIALSSWSAKELISVHYAL